MRLVCIIMASQPGGEALVDQSWYYALTYRLHPFAINQIWRKYTILMDLYEFGISTNRPESVMFLMSCLWRDSLSWLKKKPNVGSFWCFWGYLNSRLVLIGRRPFFWRVQAPQTIQIASGFLHKTHFTSTISPPKRQIPIHSYIWRRYVLPFSHFVKGYFWWLKSQTTTLDGAKTL